MPLMKYAFFASFDGINGIIRSEIRISSMYFKIIHLRRNLLTFDSKAITMIGITALSDRMKIFSTLKHF